MKSLQYDVVVVGAGLAGAAMALSLAKLPLRIALVEANPIPEGIPDVIDSVTGYDARVSAITAASQQLLEQLGCWQAISAARACAYQHMHVWDADGTGSVDFDAGDVQQAALGHIVENRIIAAALMTQLRDKSRVDIFDGTPLSEYRRSNRRNELLLESGVTLKPTLLIAADGANSRIRQWAGFRTREWDYEQVALVATVATAEPHQRTAWQRFMPTGPLAFLPLADSAAAHCYSSIVWSATPALATELLALDDAAFQQRLGAALEQRLGAVTASSKRFGFPLRQRHAVDYVQPGVVLIGDAAHTIHPLAGQGINLGFEDVRALAEELSRANELGAALDDEAVLARYQRRRKGENLAMMAAMEGFKRLFAAEAPPLRWLRNTGMSLFDRALPVKREIIRRAMGV